MWWRNENLQAVRAAQFHRHYPLMASASDDGSVHVFHATVYSDLLRNPLVVPLKILRGHEVKLCLSLLSMDGSIEDKSREDGAR